MNQDDVVEVFTSGIILVIGIFVIATIWAPDLANLLDNFLVEIISFLAYGMVFAILIMMVFQLIDDF